MMMPRCVVVLLLAVFGSYLSAQQDTATKSAPSATAPSEQTSESKPVYNVGGNVRPPVLTHQVDPEYPDEASRKKFSGAVEVGLTIDENGMPQNVYVIRGAGHGMDEAAVDAVRQYRFKPAMRGDTPVAVKLFIDVQFKFFK